MLTLNDGRAELWQWDTGRKLTVDAECSQVHFSNKVFGRSIDVDVADGVATIPDILLQTDKDLNAWAFVGTAENGYTKISKTFKVNRRNKPADYVFTPPDQTTLAELEERLRAIEESQDPDAIKNAVEDYLEQNPVEIPVESVNGKTGKVELTAKDVGAISLDDLQEATNDALAQAKASGEFKGEKGDKGDTGATGAQGEPGKDGADGKDGEDYVLTNEDKQEIAEMAAELVDVPDSGGNVDLTGYATEKYVREYAQPKGDYLTSFTETDPTVPSWAKQSTKPSYTKSEVGLGNVDNVKQYSASNPPPYPVTSVNGKTGAVTLDIVTDAVRYIEQTLTEEQKAQARQNIDAVSKGEIFTTRQEFIPDYTNLIDTYGLNHDKSLDSSGTLVDNAGTYVSEYIPVKLGDVIRIKDPGRTSFGSSLMFALYKANKAESSGVGKTVANIQSANNNDCGVITIDGNVATWTLNPINYYFWKNFAWMRIMTFSADMVITVNEPLTESIKEQLVMKPSVKVTKDSIEGDVGAKPLAGKTVVGFGDSIFGYVRDSTSVLSYVAKETGATVHNVGFGGCRMATHPSNGYAAFSMWALAKAIVDKDWTTQDAQAASGSGYFAEHLALLKTIDFNNVDMVVIHYGANDFTAGNPGVAIDNANDSDDYNTLCGALRYSIEKLLTAYPHLQIFIDLPTYRWWPDTGVYPETYTNYLGKHYHEYADALRGVAAEYNLPVIDCYYGLGVNKLTVATMTSDGAHHSAIGRQRLGEFIAGYLSARQASGKGGVDTTVVNALISTAIGNAIGGSY